MSCQARAKPILASHLPQEVVQHIFSLRRFGVEGDLVLSLKDRMHTMAVCRAWYVFLDPKCCPIEDLDLDGTEEADLRIAVWVTTKQPMLRSLGLKKFATPQLLLTLSSATPRTALEDLFLYGEAVVIQDCLASIPLFPSLTRLCLHSTERDERAESLDLATLEPLSALQQLECKRWPHVELSTALPLLRQLSSLELWHCGVVVVEAELPSLRELLVRTANGLWLAGEGLHMPQLTQLRLEHLQAVAVKWTAAPQLAALSTVGCQDMNTDGLATLCRLTSLSVGQDWLRDSFRTANAVLHAAPPSVQRLSIEGFREGWLPPPPLQSVPQLTSLTSNKPAIIPHLGALAGLQHLEIQLHSAAALTFEHAEWLNEKTSLRRLCFTAPLETNSGAGLRRVQALRKLLPINCILEQPM